MVGDIFQPTHLLLILVVALFVLGPKRLPEVGRTLGNGIRDFRSAINGEPKREELDDTDEPTASDHTPQETTEPVQPVATSDPEPIVFSDPEPQPVGVAHDADVVDHDQPAPVDAPARSRVSHAGPVVAGPPPAVRNGSEQTGADA